MRHRHFVTRLLNRPQLITPAAGAAVCAALLPGYRLDGFGGDSAPTERDPREYQLTPARTAVIPVIGELVHRGGGMDAMSGVTSYEVLQDMVMDALTDPSVTGILLDVDSPGGEAGGVLDFSEWLAAQRGSKPIVAFANGMACSAAYAIASGADTLLISADGFAGSIGVVTYHLDNSGALGQAGVVVTYVYAGDRKIDGNPSQPLSGQAQAELQGFVDTTYARFCNVVATNRGISVATVQATQAGIFMGQDAVDLGLADDIATMEEALMATAPRTAPAGSRFGTAGPSAAARPLLASASEVYARYNARTSVKPAAATPAVASPALDAASIFARHNARARGRA